MESREDQIALVKKAIKSIQGWEVLAKIIKESINPILYKENCLLFFKEIAQEIKLHKQKRGKPAVISDYIADTNGNMMNVSGLLETMIKQLDFYLYNI